MPGCPLTLPGWAPDQPDALVSFEYEGIYLAFSNIISFNSTAVEQGVGPGWLKNPGGTVTSELVFSTDAKHWRYLVPGQSFVPRGETGKDFDCCSIFTAKQGYQPSQQPDNNGTMRVCELQTFLAAAMPAAR